MLVLSALVLLAASAADEYRAATHALANNDSAGALAAVASALRTDPRYVPAIALGARIEMIEGRLDASQERLENAIAVLPKEPRLRFLLGLCLYLKNDFAPARDAFAMADQKDADVLLYSALTEEGLNNPEAAKALFERALNVSGRAEVCVAYARMLRTQGEPARAEVLADRALQAEPNSRGALYEKGQALFTRAEWKEAAAIGEKALRASGQAPSEREIRYLLIRAYSRLGNMVEAGRQREAFEKLPLPLVR